METRTIEITIVSPHYPTHRLIAEIVRDIAQQLAPEDMLNVYFGKWSGKDDDV